MTPFFTAGGTLSRGALSYISREADEKLFRALDSGLYAFLLNSRQMGKSSLAVRTLDRLRNQGVTCAMVDLTRLGGQNLSAAQWYAALTREVMVGTGLKFDLAAWMRQNLQTAPARAFFDFLEGPLLDGLPGNIVLLLDEIDVTQNLTFDTDGFYAGIRELYNRRSVDAKLNRLTFCLVGVALPSDLISDPRVTPFNIGERIVLRDFTAEEVAAYGPQLGPQGAAIIARLHHWTGGHPYLTQSLCAILSERPEADVEALIKETLLQPSARETNTNLVDVARRVLHGGNSNRADILTLYERVWKKRNVSDDESNLACATLKLSGIVKSVEGRLRVRNHIYAHVFNREWIAAGMPEQEARRQRRAYRKGVLVACAVGLPVVGLITALAAVAISQAHRADKFAALASEKALSEHKARVEQERSAFKAYAMALNDTARAFESGRYEEAMQNLVDLKQQPGRGWELSFLANRVNRYGHVTYTGKSRVGGIGYRRDGSLVTLSDDLRLRIWSSDGSTLMKSIVLPEFYSELRIDSPADVAYVFTNRGHLARVPLTSGQVEWSTTTGIRRLYALDLQRGPGLAFLFDATGTGTILGIDKATGKLSWKGHVPQVSFNSGAVSPDGKTIAFGGVVALAGKPDRTLLGALDVASGRTLWMHDVPTSDRVSFVASAGDDKTFWFGHGSGNLDRLNVATLQTVSHVKTTDGDVMAVSRLPHSGRWVVSVYRGIRILDAQGTKIVDNLDTRTQVITSAVRADGAYVAAAGVNGEATLWSLGRYDHGPVTSDDHWFDPTISLPPPLERKNGYSAWSLSADGQTLAAVQGREEAPGAWSVFRASDGKRLWTIDGTLTATPVFTRDGKIVAAGLQSSTQVRLFEAQTGRILLTVPGAFALCFSPDDTKILVGGGPTDADRKLVRVFDLRTGQKTLDARVNEDLATSGAWSADGNRLLLGGEDHIIRYFDIPTHRLLTSMPGHDSQVTQLLFCQDGQRALSSGDDGTVRIWKLGIGDADQTLALPGARGRCRVCELPGGRILASWKDTAGIFDLETGQTLMLFPTGEPGMRFCSTKDGRTLGLSRSGKLLELPRTPSEGAK